MFVRTAEAHWEGTLRTGRGTLHMPHAPGPAPYSYRSRFTDEGDETNPEELIAAAHAGCFSMALSLLIEQAGFAPKRVHTRALVHLDRKENGFYISGVDLETEAEVPGMDAEAFQRQAEAAKQGCPVSQALAATPIRLSARLL